MKKFYVLPGIIVLITISLSGCSTSNEFNNIIYDIEKTFPSAGIEKKMNLSLDNNSRPTADSFMEGIECFSNSDSEIIKSLKSIKKVRVTTYTINRFEESSGRTVSKIINRELKRHNWRCFLTVEKDYETFCGYYKQINNNYCGIFIFIQNDDGMVLVELNGYVKNIRNKLIKEHNS